LGSLWLLRRRRHTCPLPSEDRRAGPTHSATRAQSTNSLKAAALRTMLSEVVGNRGVLNQRHRTRRRCRAWRPAPRTHCGDELDWARLVLPRHGARTAPDLAPNLIAHLLQRPAQCEDPSQRPRSCPPSEELDCARVALWVVRDRTRAPPSPERPPPPLD